MDTINLEDGKILFGSDWLSVEDLTKKIQAKMQAGDMKFADMATALETLNKRLEDSHALEVRLVLTKDEYQKLKDLGEADDKECVKRAIMAFIDAGRASVPGHETAAEGPLDEKKKLAKVKCANCDSPFEAQVGGGSEVICSQCGARGLIKPSKQDLQTSV